MNNNMGMVSFFDMFNENEDIKEFNQEQNTIVANNKPKTEEKAQKSDTKKSNVKAANTKAPVDPNKEIEESCAKCEKIVVKVFGQQVFTIEDETEIKSIKIDEILKRVIEAGFEEFKSIKARWNVSISEETKTGYLIPTYDNFFAKG